MQDIGTRGADRPVVLFVDDEPIARKQFQRLVGPNIEVVCLASADEARRYMERADIYVSVVICDQRMPHETGVELLTHTRRHWPHSRRILTTAFADTAALEASINDAAVHRLIAKPWQVDETRRIVHQEVLQARLPQDGQSEPDPQTAAVALELATPLFKIECSARAITARGREAAPSGPVVAKREAEAILGHVRSARMLLGILADHAQHDELHNKPGTITGRGAAEYAIELSGASRGHFRIEVETDFIVHGPEHLLSLTLARLLIGTLLSEHATRIVIRRSAAFGVIALRLEGPSALSTAQELGRRHVGRFAMRALGGRISNAILTPEVCEVRLCMRADPLTPSQLSNKRTRK